MKIAILSTSYFPESNGASIRTNGIAEGLRAYGYEIIIIVPGKRYSEEKIEYGKVYRIPVKKSRYAAIKEKVTKVHVARKKAFEKYGIPILRKESVDIVHTRQPLDLFLVGKKAKEKLHILWVTEAHKLLSITDYENKKIPRVLFRWLQKREVSILNESDLVVTMTSSGKQTLQKSGVRKPIIAVANATSIKIGKKQEHHFPFNDKYQYILYAGSIREVEAIGELLYCFQKIHNEMPSTRLMIIGDGVTGKLLSSASRLGIKEVVFFLGEMPFKEMAYYYQHATLFMHYRPKLTYHEDIIGLKFYDAIKCLLPLAVSNVGELGRLVKEKKIGAVFQADNREACVQAVIALLRDKKARQTAIRNMMQLRKQITWKKSCQNLDKVYKKMGSYLRAG